MTYIGERLKDLRIKNKLSQNDLALSLGIKRHTISAYETDSITPPIDKLILISKYFNVSIDYLLCKDVTNTMLYNIPLYGSIPAGVPNWCEQCLEGYLPIDPNLMNIANPEECFFLRVNGDSMNKTIPNGSFALIRKQDSVENGDIAAVLVDNDEATLKKFNQTENIVVLNPDSTLETYKPIIVDIKKTNIKILGKYIGKFEIQ